MVSAIVVGVIHSVLSNDVVSGSSFFSRLALSSTGASRFVYEDEPLYILGGVGNHQTLLRVAAASSLLRLDFATVEVLQIAGRVDQTGVQVPAMWGPMVAKNGATSRSPASLFSPSFPEASLHWDFSAKEWVVVGQNMAEGSVQQCRARDVASTDWTCKIIFVVDQQLANNFDLVTYAGKAHPDLVVPDGTGSEDKGGLILSYVSNTLRGPGLLFTPQYRDMYTPKFVHIEPKKQ